LEKRIIRLSGLSVLIIFCLVMVFSIPGCKTGEAAAVEEEAAPSDNEQEEAAAEGETEEEPAAEEETDEEGDGEETDGIKDLEITGNINILNGMEISDSVNGGKPIAVMIENSPDSRPQSGLINADIVFEVVDEYGVTRYVAVFSSKEPDIMGPVRSARIYYAEIARSFDPIYVFWGTYGDAYPVLKTMDLDLLDANSDAHVPYTNAGWRDSSRSDVLEHTAFIDIAGIKEDAESHGYSLDGGQSPMKFKLDAAESERGNISDIEVNFSHDNYKVGFDYDPSSNTYLKTLAGAPHVDFETGQQIGLNNVIVMITDIDGPINQWGHMVVRTTGTHEAGQAYYFMDGNIVEGTWGRSSIFDPFEFRDLEGYPVLFNRGSTWVSMIQGIDRLSY
jgi:hypothetical protein